MPIKVKLVDNSSEIGVDVGSGAAIGLFKEALKKETKERIAADEHLQEEIDDILTSLGAHFLVITEKEDGSIDISLLNDKEEVLDTKTITLTKQLIKNVELDYENGELIFTHFDNTTSTCSISAIKLALAEEVTRATGVEEAISADLAEEVARAIGIETSLRADLTNEISRATNTELTIDRKLDTEIARAENADAILEAAINQEVQDRIADVNDEENRAKSTERNLDNKIEGEISRATGIETGLRTDLTAEIDRAGAAEETLQDNIDAEEDARIEADRVLQTNINYEADARSSADNTLQTNIDNEERLRTEADSNLQDAIDAEEFARQSADTNLGNIKANKVIAESGETTLNKVAGLDANGDLINSNIDISDVATQSGNNTFTNTNTYTNNVILDNTTTGQFSPKIQLKSNLTTGQIYQSGWNTVLSSSVMVGGTLSPLSNNYTDIGSSNSKWKDLYLSNRLYLNGPYLFADGNNRIVFRNSSHVNMGWIDNSSGLMLKEPIIRKTGASYGIKSPDASQFTEDKTIAITDDIISAINNLNANSVGQAGSYLKTISESAGIITTTPEQFDRSIDSNASHDNVPSSQAVREFVNSSVSTNTANFLGTYTSVSLLPTTGVTNNDYAFVTNSVLPTDYASFAALDAVDKATLTNYDYGWVINAEDNTKFDLYRFDQEHQTWGLRVSKTDKNAVALNDAYNRYKYNASTPAWVFEYTLNNSSFTAAQWAAINSTINADKVSRIVYTDTDQTITGEKTIAYGKKLKFRTQYNTDVNLYTDAYALRISGNLIANTVQGSTFLPYGGESNTVNVGASNNRISNIYLRGGLSDGSSNYKALLPNMSTWTEDKTLVTEDRVNELASNKADKVLPLESGEVVEGMLAGLDSTGNLTNSNIEISDVVTKSGNQTIEGQKTFTSTIKSGVLGQSNAGIDLTGIYATSKIYQNNSNELCFKMYNGKEFRVYSNGIYSTTNDSANLGTSSYHWKEGFINKITDVNGSYSSENTINSINASDIVSLTLTQAQFNIIQNNKYTHIVGTISNLTDPCLFCGTMSSANQYRGSFVAHNQYGQSYFGTYIIDTNLSISFTKTFFVSPNGRVNITNLYEVNSKRLPANPSNEGTFVNKMVNGTWSWIEDTSEHDLSLKADKVIAQESGEIIEGKLAGLDSDGDLTNSGIAIDNVATQSGNNVFTGNNTFEGIVNGSEAYGFRVGFANNVKYTFTTSSFRGPGLDLGNSSNKWKDLYLSGGNNFSNSTSTRTYKLYEDEYNELVVSFKDPNGNDTPSWLLSGRQLIPLVGQYSSLGKSGNVIENAYINNLSDGTNSIVVANIQEKVLVRRFI